MKRLSKIFCMLLTVIMLVCSIPAELTASAANYKWAGAWGSPAIESGITLGNLHLQDYIPAGSTIRTVVTPTLSGTKIRLKFSNLFGKKAITIDEATVATTGATDDVIIENSATQITFNGGLKTVTIAPGTEIFSDEINFSTTALQKISISTYYKSTTYMYTIGMYGGTTYLASSLGNRTHDATMTEVATRLDFTSNTITYHVLPFLTRVDVYAEDAYSVVILGDSTVTNDIYYYLAKKLQENGIKNVGVVMSGIIGNELLNDGTGLLGKVYGQSLLTRAKRDAFDVAGVKYVIVKIGINDVLHPMLESNNGKMPLMTSSQVIAGYRELSKQAAEEHVKVYLCTRTPYKGYERAFLGSKDLNWTQQGEDTLLEINSWVKYSSGDYFDGHINLDALRDPNDTAKLRDHMTSDGAHLTSYGQIAVADIIPEAAYGVNRELKDVASILNVDPYTPPAVPETTTKAPETTTQKQDETTTSNAGNAAVTTPSQTTTMPTGNLTITTPPQETTTLSNANQILVDNAVNNNTAPLGTVVDSNNSASRQVAGFAILSAVAIAIIMFAVVMLIKMRVPSTQFTRGGNIGRANQKKKV